MTRRLRVSVDHGRCVGNAMCVATAAGAFRHNENRQSEVVNAAGASPESILEAAANCPVSAIRVEDAETGEVLFPAPTHPDPARTGSSRTPRTRG